MNRNRPLLITIIASIVLIILIAITGGARNATLPENAAGTIFTPIQRIFYDVTGSVADFFSNMFSSRDTDKENADLKLKLKQLEADSLRMQDLEQENERLKNLLSYKEQYGDLKFVTARVTAKEPSNWFYMFTINVGRSQGVDKDMPVVSSKGLVGRVVEAGGSYSKVMAIIDTRSSVSCILERARINGIAKGILQDEQQPYCKMMYLPYETDLVPGDRVVTSGLGGIFPKGILLGEVTEVIKQKDNSQKNAVIKPAVDFATLEEVMVVTSVVTSGGGEAK